MSRWPGRLALVTQAANLEPRKSPALDTARMTERQLETRKPESDDNCAGDTSVFTCIGAPQKMQCSIFWADAVAILMDLGIMVWHTSNDAVPTMSYSIDTFIETIISLDDAARHVATISGKKRNRRVILRWISRGVAGVRLPAIRIGGQLYTSAEALNYFLNESQAARFRNDGKSVIKNDGQHLGLDQQAADLGI
jgi:hypothetical protein